MPRHESKLPGWALSFEGDNHEQDQRHRPPSARVRQIGWVESLVVLLMILLRQTETAAALIGVVMIFSIH